MPFAIKIHPLFWATIFIGIITASFKEIILLFGIVFIHELGHGLMATYYGWRIHKITLLPFGGVAEVEEHGNKPLKEEIMVLLAGPLQHVWIFLLCVYLFHIGIFSEELYLFMFYNNLSILCFNLLPIWPLDGGKLLFAILSMKFPFVVAHKKMVIFSYIVLAIFFICVVFISVRNLSMWFMVGFLFVSIWSEWKRRNYIFIRFLLGRLSNSDSPKVLKCIKVRDERKLFDIFYLFQRSVRHEIIINDVKYDESKLLHAYFEDKKILISDL